jgi:hypothetical protein
MDRVDVPDADHGCFDREPQTLFTLAQRPAGAGLAAEIEQFEHGALRCTAIEGSNLEGKPPSASVIADEMVFAFASATGKECAAEAASGKFITATPQKVTDVAAARLGVGEADEELGNVVDELAAKASV